ncbi:unnamed protein product, partial [marine sediment metagenome]
MVAVMAGRDDTYCKFGPILLEGMCWVLLDYQNELRKNQGMPELTMDDVLLKLENHLSGLQPYDWM